MTQTSNEQIADMLTETADLLERKGTNPFRVRSYRQAAETIRAEDRPLAEILDEQGLDGLKDLPHIGEKLAGSIRDITETGRSSLLERLQSETAPEELLAGVPGIGKTLAGRIHDELDVETLEELEEAAHDGRLESIEGVGAEKADGIRDALAGMLSRSARRRARQRSGRKDDSGGDKDSAEAGEEPRPSVEALLDVDAEYRQKAEAGELRQIAPKRFNPEGKAWLPILHTQRDGWDFTALFSNTAKAHELDKTDDWVVMYYERDGQESQNTIITAGSGPLKGKRIVRGREAECRRYYSEP